MKFSVCTTLKCHLTACLDTKPRNDLVRLSANWHGTEDYLASWRAIFFSHTTNLTIYLAIVPILIPCTFCDIEQGPANFFFKGLDFKFQSPWIIWSLFQLLHSAFVGEKQPQTIYLSLSLSIQIYANGCGSVSINFIYKCIDNTLCIMYYLCICGHSPIKMYLQTRVAGRIWTKGHSLLTFDTEYENSEDK